MGDATLSAAGSDAICSEAPESPAEITTQEAERRRVHELLRYFKPSSPTIDAGKKARVASDVALTAYAQLCALRLNCQRSFISLIDHDTQHIIAEATRTVSLESEDVHDEDDDALYVGATTMDLLWGLCSNTIKAFTAKDCSLNISTPYVKASHLHHVVNDLSKAPGHDTRSYVTGWPHMRYYAGVPIHSPAGYTIGTLCVVDNKPRDGLDTRGLTVLKEIAVAIMNHLDLVVSKSQRKRAERMINGLGLFVEGSTNKGQWWIDSKKSSHGQKSSSPKTSSYDFSERIPSSNSVGNSSCLTNDSTGTLDETNETEEDYFGTRRSSTEPSGKSSRTVDRSPIKNGMRPNGGQADQYPSYNGRGRTAKFSFAEPSVGRFSNTLPNEFVNKYGTVPHFPRGDLASTGTIFRKNSAFATDIDKTLDWAAKLIREAVDMDGVIFLDAQFGNMIFNEAMVPPTSNIREASQLTVPAKGSFPSGSYTFSPLYSPGGNLGRRCKLLASSTIVDGSLSSFDIYESTLHRIVRRFPHGGILKFDHDGNLLSYSEFELSRDERISRAQGPLSSLDLPKSQDPLSPSHDGDALTEAQELRSLIPAASSVMLFPLRNTNTEKLFAYNIAWTMDKTRVFEREDFVYVSSFSNLIMTELSRLDTVAADRAKADFISSISHELRSPLHGILASAELLTEVAKEPASTDIIATIQACGSTLLDTMNNLLAFAKINNITKTREQKATALEVAASIQGVQNLSSDIDLGTLVEEVMTASIAGHRFRDQFRTGLEIDLIRGPKTPLPDNGSLSVQNLVTVVCDVQPSVNWIFSTESGAWRRILMNLLGNALKYTTAGYIYVKLRQVRSLLSVDGVDETRITLCVEDSGQGISDAYLRSRLFKPFQQENSLRPGTGLGLSIVHQLVSSLNGNISVKSEIGSGTKVEISALLKSPKGSSTNHSHPISEGELCQLKGRKLGLLGFNVYPDMKQTPTAKLSKAAQLDLALRTCITNAAEDLGVGTVLVDSLYSEAADILVATENYFLATNLASLEPRRRPLIVLCSNLNLDYRPILDDNGPLMYLSQPYGPQRLKKALTAILPYCIPINETSGTHTSIAPALSLRNRSIGGDNPSPILTSTPLTPLPSGLFNSNELSKQTKRPRALLVEDNAINLKLLVTFMKKLACPYATAMDGLQAVEKYRESSGEFDVIFMDIQMPVMDGLKASCEIRKFERQESLSRTKIVALTGLDSAEAREQASQSGVDIFLTKPVPMKTLKKMIDDISDSQEQAG